MTKLNRDDLDIIIPHSNMTKADVDKLLKVDIYNDSENWKKFLRLVLITLGVGFSVTGLIFFFAYNWAELHKFIKIGLIEGLVIAATLLAVFSKMNTTTKNIILTGAALLVGVLFAVFGQIYQTGANAYDFFLGWTACIVLWALVVQFAPLWLLFTTLVNTTLILYSEQVAADWSSIFLFGLLFLVNLFFFVATLVWKKHKDEMTFPHWFSYILALAAISFATIGVCYGILSNYDPMFIYLLILTILGFGLGIWHGILQKQSFYIATIPLALIIILSAWLLKISDDGSMLLFISLFIIVSISLVVRNLVLTQKKWNNGTA
ncbi:DUF2157 domain-containing protein [Sphingobacterium sp. SYP-B4668]|uniref:DUF2157 domain-containing protein n=1 Tax=Sphingobacterium sp. SYP-B4668 TaxID=2996035 RepID=UPI0022DD7077|nr:DUF2157 domain-containing protein [Sphingobacterium sp. SYP-B4668]